MYVCVLDLTRPKTNVTARAVIEKSRLHVSKFGIDTNEDFL